MHGSKLFNRDIIYILYGITAIRSLKNRLIGYKEVQRKYLRSEKAWEKATHYVPILASPLVFGFQAEVDPRSYRSESAFCIPSLTTSGIRVNKYFFQFFVPNRLVAGPSEHLALAEEIEDMNLCGTNCEDSIAHSCVSEFKEPLMSCFEHPAADDCAPVLHGNVAASKQRLSQLLTPNVKISVNKSANLLLNFLKLTAPSIEGSDAKISLIWQYYRSLDNTGLEVFKNGPDSKVKMAVYSASLYGIHIKTKEQEEIKYLEQDPQYAQIPLFDKVQELSQKYPSLLTLNMADVEEDSWFGVYWAPLACAPHLKITGRFLTLHKVAGCSRIAVDCRSLDVCEYWGEVLEDKESKELVEEEKEKALRFLCLNGVNSINN